MTPEYIKILRRLVSDSLNQTAEELRQHIMAYAEGLGDWQQVDALMERVKVLQQVDAHLAIDEYNERDELARRLGMSFNQR
jgi:hypothetical protein